MEYRLKLFNCFAFGLFNPNQYTEKTNYRNETEHEKTDRFID